MDKKPETPGVDFLRRRESSRDEFDVDEDAFPVGKVRGAPTIMVRDAPDDDIVLSVHPDKEHRDWHEARVRRTNLNQTALPESPSTSSQFIHRHPSMKAESDVIMLGDYRDISQVDIDEQKNWMLLLAPPYPEEEEPTTQIPLGY